MNLSLRVLRYVVETADCGSVTEAARRLNVSQPSVSTALAQVEAEIGVQIFVRHHARGVTLSAAGQRLINDARHLLNHARDFEQSAHLLGDALRGEIVVGSFPTLAIRFMPTLLAGFSKRYPGISVKLEEGDQHEMIELLVSGKTELAMSYHFALPDEIIGEKLADLPPYVIVGAAHRFAERKSISLAELADDPFILLDLPHSRDYFFRLFSTCGLEPSIAFRTRSSELIRGLVGNDQGYTIHNVIPRTTIGYDGSRIAVLSIVEELPPATVTFMRLRRQELRPAVQAFANYMKEAFSPTGVLGSHPLTS